METALAPARPTMPLTAQTEITEDLALYADGLHRQIVGLVRARRKITCRLGQVLVEMRQQGAYRALGYDSMDVYLSQPDLGLSRSTAYRCMEYYTQTLKLTTADPSLPALATPAVIDQIGPDKLRIIQPLLERGTPQERQDWLREAQAQPAGALARQVREAQGQTITQYQEFLEQQVASIRDLAGLLGLQPTPQEALTVARQLREKVDHTALALTEMAEA